MADRCSLQLYQGSVNFEYLNDRGIQEIFGLKFILAITDEIIFNSYYVAMNDNIEFYTFINQDGMFQLKHIINTQFMLNDFTLYSINYGELVG